MFLLTWLQFIFIALLIAFGITQMILPIVSGRKMFPMFRAKRNEIEEKIVDLHEELYDANLEREARELAGQLKKATKK